MSNRAVIAKILRDVGDRAPKFRPGQRVTAKGFAGVINVIYANTQSAIDTFVIQEDWYERLAVKPKTPKSGFWYGVILEDAGAVLLGEDDMDAAS